MNTPDGPMIVELSDYAYANFGTKPRLVSEVTVEEHLNVLRVASQAVDSAVSKTCNMTGKTPWNEFKSIYSKAWEFGAKGVTTFNIDGQKMALLTSAEPKAESCVIDGAGRKSCE